MSGEPNWGEGASGAAGGAMTGAALGSVVPGIGTGVGALVGGIGGGLYGLFGSGDKESEQEKKNQQLLMDYYNKVQGRPPVQLGATQYGQTSGVRGQQQTLADQLAALGRGEGPSLAEQQLRSATDRNVSQQASFANSGRGGPMAAAQAMNNSARLGAQSAQDAASARIAESMKARELLGLNLHGMREADENMSQFNANQGNQMSQAQMWATLKQQGMTDDAILNILGKQQQHSENVQSRPSWGDRMLAGGAGAFSTYATMQGKGK